MFIASFDIGKKNFAFAIEENSKIVLFRNLDLTENSNKKLYLDPIIYHNMYSELEKYV